MALNDPIADLLTRIRNGSHAGLRYVEVNRSKLKLGIVKLLQEQGFIDGFLEKGHNGSGVLRIYLKYSHDRSPVVHGLKRVSRPGLRRFVGYREVPKVLGGMGIAILSTPQGIMAGHEARKSKVGGELLCYVW